MRAFAVPALAAALSAAALPGLAAPAAQPAHPAKPAPAKAPAPQAPPAKPEPAPAAKATANGPLPIQAAIPPGPLKETLRRLFLKPYAEATGTELPDPAWDGASLDALKKPGVVPDLVLVSGAQLAAGCRSQALAKLDWGPLNRDHYTSQAASDCGAGAYITATAMAWDRDKLPATPSWSDFWDVARHPGGRGLQRTARGNLEIALLADGVAPNDIYRTLRTADGVDRAFRKLDQLKPYILWWDQPGQPAQMLAAGHVLLTSTDTAPLLQAAETSHRAYGLQWSGSLTELHSWAIPQGAPHPAIANAVLMIAADIARQASFARATYLGPTARDAIDLLPPPAKAGSPSNPANAAGALPIDEGFWLDNQDKLQARFAAWVAK